MCVVSMIGDYYRQKLPEQYPQILPLPNLIPPLNQWTIPNVSREEFDALKKEVQDMKDLLSLGKQYDDENGQPDCQIEEKLQLLREIAKLVGIDLEI